MAALLQRLAAKQKADKENVARRLELRRGYARAGRERERARRIAESGLQDLPDSIAVGIEEALETPAPQAAKVADVATVEDLIARLTSIRERLFWLQSVWATTLSPDVYQEAERYRSLFQELNGQLKQQDPAEADRLVAGHEALLLSEPAPPRPRLSLATQRWFELAGEVRSTRVVRAAPKPDGYVSDGLQSFL
jgi:hypothetical protein